MNNKICNFKNCQAEGKFPAPKPLISNHRNNSKFEELDIPTKDNERLYFCLEHIRAYNNSWNYFEHMDNSEINNFFEDSIVGHRKSWHFGVNKPKKFDNQYRKQIETAILEDLLFQNFNTNHSRKDQKINKLPEQIVKALKTLELSYPTSLLKIKSQYKKLAKKYHPDINKNGSEKIKTINSAYNQLLRSKIFK